MSTDGTPRIGWIGTGRMGSALVRRLLRAGYDVAVYNRTRTKAEPLAAAGAVVVDTIAGLAALGATTYVGDGELARLVKLCHNIFLGVVIQSLAEVTVLAEKGGVPRAAFLEFLNSSVLGSVFTRYKTPALVHLDFAPTFTMPLLRKHLDLGLAEAGKLQ